MARPGLMRHRKFTRLARLVSGRALARGSLELIWDAAFENGDDLVGSPEDVEALAEWQGEAGRLAAALVESGFLDESPEGLRVHDLADHAPDYVLRRRGYEAERRKAKTCEACGAEFHSREVRARYCSPACRQAAHRERAEGETPPSSPVEDASRTRDARVTDCNAPPAPAPAPAPAPISRSDPTAAAEVGLEGDEEDSGPLAPGPHPTAVLRAGPTRGPSDVPGDPPNPIRPWEAFRAALSDRLALPRDFLRVSRPEAVDATREALDAEIGRLGMARALDVAFEVVVRAKTKPRWLSYFVPALRDAPRSVHKEAWEGTSPPAPGGPEYPEPTPEQVAEWDRKAKEEFDGRARAAP